MWWAHPGGRQGGTDGHGRYNGTLQRSDTSGETWELAAHITPGVYPAGGYGYSDMHALADACASLFCFLHLRTMLESHMQPARSLRLALLVAG